MDAMEIMVMEIGDLIITYTGFHYYSYSSNFYQLVLFGIWIFHMPFIFMTNKLNTSYIIIEFRD